MNRAMRKNMRRGCAYRKSGGGFSVGAPLVEQPNTDLDFAVKVPLNSHYSDCVFAQRPGQLFNTPNPELAQVSMAGGRQTRKARVNLNNMPPGPPQLTRQMATYNLTNLPIVSNNNSPMPNMPPQLLHHNANAFGNNNSQTELNSPMPPSPPQLTRHNANAFGNNNSQTELNSPMPPSPLQLARHNANAFGNNNSHTEFNSPMPPSPLQLTRHNANTFGNNNIPTPNQTGGVCPCMMRRGGGWKRRTQRRMKGGASYGFSIQPNTSVGGDGPNVGALVAPVPCDARAGSMNPNNQSMGSPDPRAPVDLYSLTPNQSGGAALLGNAFDDSCYHATGSKLPVYNASSAGFHFEPSSEAGGTLPDGVTAYMDRIPHAARLGGARRTQRKNIKTNRKNRKTRR